MMRMPRLNRSPLVQGLWGILLAAAFTASASQKTHKDGLIEFTNVEEQTLQFVEYYEIIELSPEQERIKRAALSDLPAACCSSNSAYTCCCVCNLSRTVWGLTAYLITERDADAEQVQNAVKEWIGFVNPDGFSGDSCFRGGCGRSFANNGCGGMNPRQIVQ